MTQNARNKDEWKIFGRISEDLYVLCQTRENRARYVPLFLQKIPLNATRKPFAAKQIRQDYTDMQTVPDRLRWLRYSRGLRQVDVAERVGISLHVYKDLECDPTARMPREWAEQLAAFYRVPVADFLDDFNRFLYEGQAQRIRAYRESMGMGQKTFAKTMGIPIRSLQNWENGKRVINRKSWERYFKEIITAETQTIPDTNRS